MNWDFMNMHGYYGGGFMWLWFLVIILILAFILVPMFRNNNSTPNPPKESAMEILEKRFARGEISAEEYKNMKQTLESN
ncbi:SHOCT domain-containing protein [Hydrogenovibrio marinus]|uniref:SHOCT domain-containing protein n=1 Tax=Hydrogenovibrio marinus TaxID=28885 RepID=A0A066ZZ41_HYDMR|nr:SHOCT domain-containing protein [Hydrogenovibrio marinus]KDN95385.1 hypothetical protein EI16_03545 [Hydrogenovibrio marinus]BBN59873.1 hypothetical protein HVMH_1467 [Hydrogenovibrio marinus]